MTSPIDYNAVLADMLVRRSQIDAAIEVIRALIPSAATDGEGDSANGVPPAPVVGVLPKRTAVRSQATAIESDTFFGLNVADAIRKYLGMMKRPQTAQAITEALSAGGQINSAQPKVAYGNAYSALTRNKDFVKTRNKEWGLSDWYGSKSKADGE